LIMRLFLTASLLLFFTSAAGAQEDSLNAVTSALQEVLASLQHSVEQLNQDNDQLTARDSAIRKQVQDLQGQLEQLQAQGGDLDAQVQKLRENNPRRAQAIARLEKENYELDDRTLKAGAGVKLYQRSLDAGYQEDQRLLLQLKSLSAASLKSIVLDAQRANPRQQALIHLQKEKLEIMKMIYESQQRQEAMQASIIQLQKSKNFVPSAGALAHQQELKQQIKDLQDQLNAMPPPQYTMAGLSNAWSDIQLGQLEDQLKVLEKNYAQLKSLTEAMGQKTQEKNLTVNEREEGQKLQGNVDDLKRQRVSLMVQLDDLRARMVELDKRKAYLDQMAQKLQN